MKIAREIEINLFKLSLLLNTEPYWVLGSWACHSSLNALETFSGGLNLLRVKNDRILTKLSPPSFCGHAGDISTHDGDKIHAGRSREQIKRRKNLY